MFQIRTEMTAFFREPNINHYAQHDFLKGEFLNSPLIFKTFFVNTVLKSEYIHD